MLNIETLVVTPIMQNCRILWVAGQSDAVVVDPGGDCARILARLAQLKLTCTEIWLTHSHLDHCGGVQALIQSTGARLYGHKNEAMMRANVVKAARMYGMVDAGFENCPEPDVFLVGGETLAVGPISFKVLFTPGHSPGHVCFYAEATGDLIAGDTLFAGSIGRTDLPGGDHQTLLDSIKRELLVLPADVRVCSGHGEDTTIGEEIQNNPFLQ